MAKSRRQQRRKDAESDVLEQLYAADLDDFVAERDRLARSLRDEGRDDEARQVAARRKPPLPAFLANRLARDRPRETAALIAAAEQLSKAHRAGDAAGLRDAQARLGTTLRALVAGAGEVAGRPVSEAVEQRLAATLRAASVDPSTASLLRRGVLPDEVESAGFDALAGMSVKRSPTKSTSKGQSARAERAEDARRARAERLESELEDANEALRAAERALANAEREMGRARRRVSDLENRLKRRR